MSTNTAQYDTKNKQPNENQGKSGEIKLEGYPAEHFITGSTISGTSSYFSVIPSPAPPISPKKLRAAILACIRAARSLGRTEMNTQEIANALEVSVQEVNDALESLKKHGVRRR